MTRLRGIKYFGGKSPTGGRRTGQWIARQLPNPRGWTYVEPFGGMAGVMLARQPRGQEILNDTNAHVVNLWRVLRDRPDDLARQIAATPQARALYDEAADVLDAHDAGQPLDPLRRAWATYTLLNFSMLGAPTRSTFVCSAFTSYRSHTPAEILALANRMRSVTLECCDAIELIDRLLRATSEVVIYLDPPYASTPAQNRAYGKQSTDRLTDRLLATLAAIPPRDQRGHPARWWRLAATPNARGDSWAGDAPTSVCRSRLARRAPAVTGRPPVRPRPAAKPNACGPTGDLTVAGPAAIIGPAVAARL